MTCGDLREVPVGRMNVLGTGIHLAGWDETVAQMNTWAEFRVGKVICACNVHSLITARSHPQLTAALSAADLVVPDGAPVAWLMRRLGASLQERIDGPTLMWRYCEASQDTGVSCFLYGNTKETLDRLSAQLKRSFPGLRIAGAYSPPFRALTPDEDQQVVQLINDSGASVVWVSLGCPKQEAWMNDHRNSIRAVMVGVGAAFDYHAGTLWRAPVWMRRYGMEWLFRLLLEPRRLWRRYLSTNLQFVSLAAAELIRRGRH